MAMSLFIIVNYKKMKNNYIYQQYIQFRRRKVQNLKNCLLKMISKNLIIKMNIDIDLNYTFNIDIILRFEQSRLYKHREDDTMFISKQELYEKLQYVTPRTFAYLNEIDYYNLLMIIEEHQISIPPIHQLRKTLRGSKIMKPKNRVDNCYIHLKDEIPTPINNEQLSFLHFYPRQQIHLILSAYSRMKSLKLQSSKTLFKTQIPLRSAFYS